MIHRTTFINKVFELLEGFPAVGIVGTRQVGKTTLARNLLPQEKFVYLDLESDLDLAKLTDPGLFLRRYQDKCVILDEIQVRQDLFPLLRSLIDEDRRPGRFLILGSASPSLLRKSSDSLAGRIAYLELPPLILNELDATSQNKLWLRGGFPLSFLAKSDNRSHKWRIEFIRSYVERDLPQLGLDTDPRTLKNFLRMLAHQTGKIWNAASFAKSLGVTSPTVKRYLNFLDSSFLITILEPYYLNLKKRIVKSPKVYFGDTGIVHTLLNLHDFESIEGHPVLGFSWENFVLNQIMHTIDESIDAMFYSTHQGAEIDILLVKSNKPYIGIEVKYSNAPKISKGLIQAVEDLQTRKNFVITPSSDNYPVHSKIDVISLSEFLSLVTNGDL